MTKVNVFLPQTERKDKTRCLQIPFRGHKNVGKTECMDIHRRNQYSHLMLPLRTDEEHETNTLVTKLLDIYFGLNS